MLWLCWIGCAVDVERVETTFTSEAAGDTYDIQVLTPPGHDGIGLPLLVFRDGDYLGRHDGDLAARYDEGLELMVVAIAYQGFSNGLFGGLKQETKDRRLRDITPRPVEGFEGTGQAAAFETFVVDELVPWAIDEHGASADPGDHATFGYSAFGASVAHGLITRPAAFGTFCMGSPSLSVDDRVLFEMFDAVQPSSLAGHAVITYGDREDAINTDAADDFATALQAVDGVTVDQQVFAGKNHHGAMRPAFEACLDAL